MRLNPKLVVKLVAVWVEDPCTHQLAQYVQMPDTLSSFSRDVRDSVKRESPDASGHDIERIIGKKWADLSDKKKHRYQLLAKAELVSTELRGKPLLCTTPRCCHVLGSNGTCLSSSCWSAKLWAFTVQSRAFLPFHAEQQP